MLFASFGVVSIRLGGGTPFFRPRVPAAQCSLAHLVLTLRARAGVGGASLSQAMYASSEAPAGRGPGRHTRAVGFSSAARRCE
jgi:hypothetical protein